MQLSVRLVYEYITVHHRGQLIVMQLDTLSAIYNVFVSFSDKSKRILVATKIFTHSPGAAEVVR